MYEFQVDISLEMINVFFISVKLDGKMNEKNRRIFFCRKVSGRWSEAAEIKNINIGQSLSLSFTVTSDDAAAALFLPPPLAFPDQNLPTVSSTRTK